jgi:hypothetical protein
MVFKIKIMHSVGNIKKEYLNIERPEKIIK